MKYIIIPILKYLFALLILIITVFYILLVILIDIIGNIVTRLWDNTKYKIDLIEYIFKIYSYWYDNTMKEYTLFQSYTFLEQPTYLRRDSWKYTISFYEWLKKPMLL